MHGSMRPLYKNPVAELRDQNALRIRWGRWIDPHVNAVHANVLANCRDCDSTIGVQISLLTGNLIHEGLEIAEVVEDEADLKPRAGWQFGRETGKPLGCRAPR